MKLEVLILLAGQLLSCLSAFLLGWFLGSRAELKWMRREMARLNGADLVLELARRGRRLGLRWSARRGPPTDVA